MAFEKPQQNKNYKKSSFNSHKKDSSSSKTLAKKTEPLLKVNTLKTDLLVRLKVHLLSENQTEKKANLESLKNILSMLREKGFQNSSFVL